MPENKLFSPLATPEDIAHWDNLSARDYDLPTLLLMENAAREALLVLQRTHGVRPGMSVVVLAGAGNNGGDGIALARQLHNLGCRVRVCTVKSPGSYRGIARSHLHMAKKAGVQIDKLRFYRGASALPAEWYIDEPRTVSAGGARVSPPLPQILPEVVVDAMLGAGFKAPLRDNAISLVRQVNALRARGVFVLALDIPSGLGSLSGRPEPEAVKASVTVTFAAAKPGLCLPWAKPYTGELYVREIGLPAKLISEEAGPYRLVNPQPGVISKPSPLAHKTQKGRVLVIGGSPGLTGAPALAALGAARAGAGLVSVAAPAGLTQEIKSGYPEIMTLPLGLPAGGLAGVYADGLAWDVQEGYDPNQHWQPEYLPALLEFIANMNERSALVIGPGIGREPYVAELIEAIIRQPHRPPLVLDADGLFPFRLEADLLPGRDEYLSPHLPVSLLRPTDVLTPHPGEMLRLLGLFDQPEEEAINRRPYGDLLELEERTAAVRLFCEHSPGTLLLKGPATLIARRGLPISLAPLAESNLGVGGSGDVLSGIIAALMARNIPALEAACLGAHLHGRAGSLTRRKFPAGGNLAGDVAECVAKAMWELYEES